MTTEQERGHLYIIESEEGPVKIGISGDPEARIDAIRRASGRTFVRRFISPAMPYYAQLEVALHKHFGDRRTVGEWFDISFNEAVRAAHMLGANVDPELWKVTERYVRGAIARKRMLTFFEVERSAPEMDAFLAGMGQEACDDISYADDVDRMIVQRAAAKYERVANDLIDAAARLGLTGLSFYRAPPPALVDRMRELAREVRAMRRGVEAASIGPVSPS